jgi:hypothetical protein
MRENEALHRVTSVLRDIRSRGSFAVRRHCAPDDLALQILGCGTIRFPISATQARTLRKVAHKAPFGLRDKTLIDARIRDTWQIAKSHVKIDARGWNPTLRVQLRAIQEQLGLPDNGRLVADFYKLLLYEPGQFFVPHQDSEKTDDMVGTLLVELPSDYTGGAVIVDHHGDKKTFRRTTRCGRELTLIAFYADCHHEIRPVKSGHRVVLTYNLRFRGAVAPTTTASTAVIDRLTKSIDDYFATPVPASRYDKSPPERPDRFIYLLDHEYTQRSLSWARLKNADRPRAAALCAVAQRLDCEAYLALADVHERWGCESDDWGHRRWGRRYHRAPPEGDDYVLTDLEDTEIEVGHWLNAAGTAAPEMASLGVGDSEVCFTRPSTDLEPFNTEHEGWMGNWGNTVDRWYHRAALVMWPKERGFVMRAKVAPAWAIDQLLEFVGRGELGAARAKAESLLPFWSRAARADETAVFFAATMKVAHAVDDRELATALLDPFVTERLGAANIKPLVLLLERYGLTWLQARFTTWHGIHRRETRAWLPFLTRLCVALHKLDLPDAKQLTTWLLMREVTAIGQTADALGHGLVVNQRFLRDGYGLLIGDMVHVLRAASSIGERTSAERLVHLIVHETAFPMMELGKLLRRLRAKCPPAGVRALGVGALYEHSVACLLEAVAHPPRSKENWSIEPPTRCTCALCAELAEFLRDPAQTALDWPLAKRRRQHIHRTIDAHDLPVSHTTHRRGSPYTLRLTKLPSLFERDARSSAAQHELLGWLRKQRRAFVQPE